MQSNSSPGQPQQAQLRHAIPPRQPRPVQLLEVLQPRRGQRHREMQRERRRSSDGGGGGQEQSHRCYTRRLNRLHRSPIDRTPDFAEARRRNGERAARYGAARIRLVMLEDGAHARPPPAGAMFFCIAWCGKILTSYFFFLPKVISSIGTSSQTFNRYFFLQMLCTKKYFRKYEV